MRVLHRVRHRRRKRVTSQIRPRRHSTKVRWSRVQCFLKMSTMNAPSCLASGAQSVVGREQAKGHPLCVGVVAIARARYVSCSDTRAARADKSDRSGACQCGPFCFPLTGSPTLVGAARRPWSAPFHAALKLGQRLLCPSRGYDDSQIRGIHVFEHDSARPIAY